MRCSVLANVTCQAMLEAIMPIKETNRQRMLIALSNQEGNMLSYQDFLTRQEHYKDLLQEAEHERLIQAAGLRQPGNWKLHRKVAGWIGTQMVRWGWKLQSYGTNATTPLSAKCQ